MNKVVVSKPDTNRKTITLTRVYNASRATVFDAWTNPVSLEKWFGPKGFSAKVLKHDFRVGGNWRFQMIGSNGTTFHHFGTFVEITPPATLKFTWASEEQLDGWRDEHGNPTLVTVRIDAHANGTQVTLTHEDLQSADVRQSLTYGWGGGLEQLADFFIP